MVSKIGKTYDVFHILFCTLLCDRDRTTVVSSVSQGEFISSLTQKTSIESHRRIESNLRFRNITRCSETYQTVGKEETGVEERGEESKERQPKTQQGV